MRPRRIVERCVRKPAICKRSVRSERNGCPFRRPASPKSCGILSSFAAGTAWMPSTRSGQEPKNQRAAAEVESEASASNDFVAPPSPAPVVAPSPVMKSASNGAPVVMMVTGHWNPPPGIGEIEMILRSSHRMQHRIMRIEVRAECAFVEVHPQDVAVCTGVFELGGVQVRNSRACSSCHAARPTTPPNCALLAPGARRPSLRVPWS